jgi:hypothetical protein
MHDAWYDACSSLQNGAGDSITPSPKITILIGCFFFFFFLQSCLSGLRGRWGGVGWGGVGWGGVGWGGVKWGGVGFSTCFSSSEALIRLQKSEEPSAQQSVDSHPVSVLRYF